jgi:hypothetical protein
LNFQGEKNPFCEIKVGDGMKVKVSKEEKRKLDYYYSIMCDSSLSIHQRRWAKMMFDLIYEKALRRT